MTALCHWVDGSGLLCGWKESAGRHGGCSTCTTDVRCNRTACHPFLPAPVAPALDGEDDSTCDCGHTTADHSGVEGAGCCWHQEPDSIKRCPCGKFRNAQQPSPAAEAASGMMNTADYYASVVDKLQHDTAALRSDWDRYRTAVDEEVRQLRSSLKAAQAQNAALCATSLQAGIAEAEKIDRLTKELKAAQAEVDNWREGEAMAMALVLSHEGRIERLTAEAAVYRAALEQVAADGAIGPGQICGWCSVIYNSPRNEHNDGCPVSIAREALGSVKP